MDGLDRCIHIECTDCNILILRETISRVTGGMKVKADRDEVKLTINIPQPLLFIV